MDLHGYMFWSEEHGEVYVYAPDIDKAWEAFYEDRSGNGDYEVVVHTLNERGEIDE